MSQDIEHKELVKACVKKKRKAQEQLYKKFAPMMYDICKHYAESRDEAMDFLQEGFISVFKSISKFNFEGSLEGWIKRIIVRRCIDGIRKRSKYNEVTLEFDIETEDDQEHILSTEENLRKVKQLIEELPPKAALILKLFFLEGYGHKDIAEIMDISEGTSKSQLNRAKSLIRQQMLNKT